MKLKVLFTTLNALIICLMVVLCLSVIYMYKINHALVQSNTTRYESLTFSEELRKSSDDLTRYCRSYVQTGDSIWENKYLEVLDIRNGKIARPDGRIISLQDSMIKLGFTKIELEKLKEAEHNLNKLIWTDKTAFNAMKGLYADKTKQFTIKREPDTIFARTIMFDKKYHQDKAAIMEPIDTCIKMVKWRTENEVEKITQSNNSILIISIIFLIIIISVISIVSFFLFKQKIIWQLEELKKEKERAEINDNKFRFIFEKSPDIITITSQKGRFIDCNPAALNFLQFNSKDELENSKTLQTFVNPHDSVELLDEIGKNGFVRNWEIKFNNFKGTNVIDCLVSAELIHNYDGKQVIISWIRDVSEKVTTENTIRKLSTAVLQNPAAIIIADLTGNIEYANPQFTIITGYTFEEAMGQNPRMLKSGIHDASMYKDLWNVISAGNVWKGELYNKRKDGTFFWEDATIAPIFNTKHEIINYVAIKQDITARKNAEMAIVKREQLLKELNVTKDKLFSIIGHDLRGPIGNLKAFVEMMLNDTDMSDIEHIRKKLQILQSIAGTTFDLLENLLDWAKSQQNEVVFEPENVNIYEISEMCISLLSENAKMKTISIHNQIPNNMVACVDNNMIMTVIRNLIMNAIKFTNNNKSIYLSATENDLIQTISIKDEGIGISPDNISKLFTLTNHFTTFGTSGEKGTGLGLLLCKEFIEKHGGKIWVESEEGKGSEFKFAIPKIIKRNEGELSGG